MPPPPTSLWRQHPHCGHWSRSLESPSIIFFLFRICLFLNILYLYFSQCLLILFLAVNGVTECFARSAMSEAEIITHTQVYNLEFKFKCFSREAFFMQIILGNVSPLIWLLGSCLALHHLHGTCRLCFCQLWKYAG